MWTPEVAASSRIDVAIDSAVLMGIA